MLMMAMSIGLKKLFATGFAGGMVTYGGIVTGIGSGLVVSSLAYWFEGSFGKLAEKTVPWPKSERRTSSCILWQFYMCWSVDLWHSFKKKKMPPNVENPLPDGSDLVFPSTQTSSSRVSTMLWLLLEPRMRKITMFDHGDQQAWSYRPSLCRPKRPDGPMSHRFQCVQRFWGSKNLQVADCSGDRPGSCFQLRSWTWHCHFTGMSFQNKQLAVPDFAPRRRGDDL